MTKYKTVNYYEEKYKRIEISELPKQLPDFKDSYEAKDILIEKWLCNWIIDSFNSKKISENYLLPQKAQIANYLGVSIGTVQNAIRYIEDKGYLKSKQRIGTMIADINSPDSDIRKLTSKREKIIISIKKMILEKGYKINHTIPSSRKLASILGTSTNTTRLAYEYLCSIGIIESRQTRGNDANWILKKLPVLSEEENNIGNSLSSETLVKKVSDDLKNYISYNLKATDRLPSHSELSKILSVSIKTVHDALKQLTSEGILLSRRGRYGTIVVKMPGSDNLQPLEKTSIFAKAEDAAFYSYQKVENEIKNMIKSNYQINDKLPSMDELSDKLDVSTNTIRKALQNIASMGILKFERGRYGGTFVIDIPEDEEKQVFKWLSVSQQYVQVYK
jgi:DNA-binding GntR family transcriptional regulator